MKKKHLLLRYLALIFQMTQIFIVIGLIGMMVLIPRAVSLVNNQSGSVGLFVNNGSPGFYVSNDSAGWTFLSILNSGTEGSLQFTHLRGMPYYGNVTLGPFRFRNLENKFTINSVPARETGVTISNLDGTVTFEHPKDAAMLLSPLQVPFVVSMLVAGLTSIALLECIRRMFQSVEQGEVFSGKNVRRVRIIGWLFIASAILRLITTGWLKHRMADLVMHHVPLGGMTVESTTSGDWLGLTTGLVILGLAEVFRQGLILKEESTLTI
jgi:hypothetical protein